MKMLLIPVPEDAQVTDDMIGDLVGALSTSGLACHEVELDDTFDLRGLLDKPKYRMALAFANLQILPIALNAFTDALAKDRELDV